VPRIIAGIRGGPVDRARGTVIIGLEVSMANPAPVTH
jgi:hypothetical protein